MKSDPSPFCIWIKSDKRATCWTGCRCKRCWLCPGIGWRPLVIKTSLSASASFDNRGSAKVMTNNGQHLTGYLVHTRLSNKLLEWTPKGKEEEEEEEAAAPDSEHVRIQEVEEGWEEAPSNKARKLYNSWWELSFFSGGHVFHPDNPKVGT
jgi:hypothetical protein